MRHDQTTDPPGNRLVWLSDEPSLFESLADSLSAEGFRPERRTLRRPEALRLRRDPAIAVIEVDEPGEALSLVRRLQPEGDETTPVLVILRADSVGLLGAALRRGTLDVVAAIEPDRDIVLARLALLRRSRSEMREISLLRREMTRRLRQIRMIHKVGKTLAFALDTEDLLRTATEALRVVFRYPRAGIFLLEEASGDIVLRAQSGHDPEAVPIGLRVPPGRGLLGAAVSGGQIVDVPDVTRDERHLALAGHTSGSELVVPFLVGGVVGGALDLQSDEVGDFDATDREAVETLADEIGAGLANARLYSELRGRTEEIETAYRRLRESDRLKDEFLSSISHELRTPLTSIRSFSEILLGAEDEDPATVNEFVDIIHEESLRLTRLVDNLLDISKMDSGMMSWNAEEREPAEVIQRAGQRVASLAQEKQVIIEIELPEDLPPVTMDEDRILQVLLNLLANAIKFSEPGAGIRLGARVSPPWLEIEVEDNGRGILPEDLPHVFEKFRQGGDTLRDKPSGTGLGLAICREIVQFHGGSIRAESQPGRGSKFTFTLPLGSRPEPRLDESGTGVAAEVRADGAAALVMIVTGSCTAGRCLDGALRNLGLRTVEATGAEEAIRLSRREKPTLIVLDLCGLADSAHHPGVLLRRSPETSDVPLYLIALSGDESAMRSLDGAVLSRPLDPDGLVRTVQRILGHRPPRVLVVEPDDRSRRYLCTHLERCGVTAVPVTSEDDLHALARTRHLDALLVDTIRPDGLVRAVRDARELADLPVVFLTPPDLAGCPLLAGRGAAAVAREIAERPEVVACATHPDVAGAIHHGAARARNPDVVGEPHRVVGRS